MLGQSRGGRKEGSMNGGGKGGRLGMRRVWYLAELHSLLSSPASSFFASFVASSVICKLKVPPWAACFL